MHHCYPRFHFIKRFIVTLSLFVIVIAANSQAGNSLTFDGIDDQINIPNSGVFDFTTGTIEAWVKPGAFNADKVFVSMRNSSGNRFSAHLNQAAGTIGIAVGATFNTVSYPFQPDIWYHITLVLTTTNTTVYVNGQFIGDTNNGIDAAVTGNSLTIGSPNDIAFPGEWFIGDIDEVRIWNTSLTAIQIKQTIFKAPAANASGLLAHYSFDEGTGTTLSNSSTNTTGIDGSLINGPVWANSPVAFGSNALSLDGSDDYVEIPWSASHDISNILTMEALVYPTNDNWDNVLMKGSYGYGLSLSGFGGTGSCGTTGKLVFWDQSQCGSTVYSQIGYSMNAWQHVAVTVEDIGTQLRIYFYVNGVEDGPYYSNATSIDNGGVGKSLYIGTQGECFCNFFEGNLDEVRVWNEVRSQAQIQAGMNNELNPTLQPNLIAYYTFDQGIASGINSGLETIIDQKGDNNGTLLNFALTGAASNYVIQNSGLLILPLNWLTFTAQKQDDKVLLNWSTANEEHTKNFIVQHSTDGTQWKNIGTITATGNNTSTTYYNFTHISPANGVNYYRIQETDNDNRKSFSQVRSVKFTNSTIPFKVVANPASNGSIDVQVNVEIDLSLYNSDGRLLLKKQVAPGVEHLDISGYAKGIYLLKGGNHLQKVIVQ